MRYQEHNWVLTLHIDTKELTDTLGPHGSKVKRKKERLCVVLTTPYRAGEHTVCAPGLDSISGRVQAEAAIAGIQSLGVMKWIQAIDYDTVAANSSPAVGAVALIERHKNCQVLKLPCRHHI